MYRPLMYNEEINSKKIYENGFTNNEYGFYESVLVAKYFRHILGYGDTRTKSSLIEFCKKNADFFNDVMNMKNIKSAVTKSRRPFVDKSKPISICQKEIDVIEGVDGYKQKKVLFAVLVLSKINNGYFYNNEWNKIRRVLRSKITNKNISELMTYYASQNLLYGTKNNYHKLLFVNTEDSPVITVSSVEINNLKKVFEGVFGKDLFICADCQESHERKSYNQKRCHECSLKRNKELTRSRVKKHRKNSDKFA